VLDWTSLSTVNRAQDFIHRHILPTLPERRIAVRIEDAVLVLIAEKAQAVADSFRNSMQPVATQMEDIANAAENLRRPQQRRCPRRRGRAGAATWSLPHAISSPGLT